MNPQKIEITPGDRQPLKITRDPLLKNCEIEVLEVKQPNGILWHHESGVIEVEKDCRPGNKMLKVRLKVKCTIDGKAVTRYMRKPVQIEVFPTLSLGLRPYMQEGAFKVRGRVENLSNREVSGALQLNENVNGKLKVLGKKRLGSIEPGQQVESLFPVDVKELLKINQPVSWQLSFQNTESRPFRIAPATFRKTVPKIDGQLDEWACLPFIAVGDSSQIIRNVGQWTPDSASAKVYLWMTPDSLCLAADVTDNDPIKNDNKPVEIWKGDNLELYIGLAGPATRTILDKSVDFQVGFAPTCAEGRPIVFLFHKDVILESAEIVVKETKTGYILEARVPLKELGEFEMNPGMLLGFDIGLDDIDSGDFALEGTNAGRQLMWNGSGSNWINPSGWGMAILQQK